MYLFLGLRIDRTMATPAPTPNWHSLADLRHWSNSDDSAYYIPQDNTNGLTLMKSIQTSDVRGNIINMRVYCAS